MKCTVCGRQMRCKAWWDAQRRVYYRAYICCGVRHDLYGKVYEEVQNVACGDTQEGQTG